MVMMATSKLHRIMFSKHLIIFTILIYCFVFIIKLTNCLRFDTDKQQHQLNTTGWRTVNFEPEPVVKKNQRQEGGIRQEIKSSKLIEWDDDELNDLHHLKDVSSMVTFQNLHGVMTPKNDYYTLRPQNELASRKTSGKKFSKLVYHGQVKRSGNVKIIDGIKLYINTHRPVTINRRVFSPEERIPRASVATMSSIGASNETKSLPLSTVAELAQEEPSALSSRWTETRSNAKLAKLDISDKHTAMQDAKSSWRPIVVIPARNRRNSVTKQSTTKSFSGSNDKLAKAKLARGLVDFKWKPITSSVTSDEHEPIKPKKIIDYVPTVSKASEPFEEPVVYGKKVAEFHQTISSPFELPFEDDGLIVANKRTHLEEPSKQREPKSANSFSTKSWDNRWTPVETTTLPVGSASSTEQVTTTTPFPTLSAPSSATVTNHSESAQKSASDVNYIYSSQPVSTNSQQDWSYGSSRQPTSSGNSYYSNYVMQPQQAVVEQPVQPAGAIIDTTSGQTPEMILDREPQPVQPADYSMPQSIASFQPAQAPLNRPINLTYDSYYNQPARAQQPPYSPPQPVRQAPTTVAPARELVRQEHHYHYYNSQQQQQQPERSSSNNNQPNREQPSQIIREIQPLLITQPVIQQPASTTTTSTPAPAQIIREIIKEVPVQTMQIQPIQLPRIVLPQTMPISMSQPTRELDPVYQNYNSGASGVPTAQRLIRQISSSIPSVSIRALPQIAGIPQIRLPIPTMQLPIKLATPMSTATGQVTRQTGSFVIPPMPKKTTTYLTETQEMPSHTTIMHTTQFTPATRTIVYTTDHQTPQMI